MTLSDEQWAFLQDVAKLIGWARVNGYKLTGGDLYRDPRAFGEYGSYAIRGGEGVLFAPYGAPNSNHKRRLAIDLNLFTKRDGVWRYTPGTESHRPLGEEWERLSPQNRWGGRFNDGNHYERLL